MAYKKQRFPDGSKLININVGFTESEIDQLCRYSDRDQSSLRAAVRRLTLEALNPNEDMRQDFTVSVPINHS